mmetsp:Transcript_5932/g.18955  ORF Transcript_5932/g.18955 Transcript_5932/m.18955 type:complete len:293 (+) Transcript_5932:126-1004(+)
MLATVLSALLSSSGGTTHATTATAPGPLARRVDPPSQRTISTAPSPNGSGAVAVARPAGAGRKAAAGRGCTGRITLAAEAPSSQTKRWSEPSLAPQASHAPSARNAAETSRREPRASSRRGARPAGPEGRAEERAAAVAAPKRHSSTSLPLQLARQAESGRHASALIGAPKPPHSKSAPSAQRHSHSLEEAVASRPATTTHAASHAPSGDATSERAQPSHCREAAAPPRAAARSRGGRGTYSDACSGTYSPSPPLAAPAPPPPPPRAHRLTPPKVAAATVPAGATSWRASTA